MFSPQFRSTMKSDSIELSNLVKCTPEEVSRHLSIPVEEVRDKDNWYLTHTNEFVYVKQANQEQIIRELYGVMLSEYFGLKTIDYYLGVDIVDGREKYVLVSYNFRNPNKTYYRPSQFFTKNVKSKMKVFEEAEVAFDYPQNLISDLKKLMVRDYMASQEDRSDYNFMIEAEGQDVQLAPLFDYETSYYGEAIKYSNVLLEFNPDVPESIEFVKNDLAFKLMFQKLLELDTYKLFKKLEGKYNIVINARIKENFKMHDDKIKEYVKELGLVLEKSNNKVA